MVKKWTGRHLNKDKVCYISSVKPSFSLWRSCYHFLPGTEGVIASQMTFSFKDGIDFQSYSLVRSV